MSIKVSYFLSLLFAALALAPAMAHALELPNKIGLSRDDYLTVQHIYNGWALLGIVIGLALLSTLILMVLVRADRTAFVLAFIGFLCIVGTQMIFWTFTYPANVATSNWTFLPDNWQDLRRNWEYSHAASAVLNLVGLIALILSALTKENVSGGE